MRQLTHSLSVQFLCICVFFLSSTQLLAETSVDSDTKESIIYKKKDVYAAFPNLITNDDGALVVTFTTRTTSSHYDTTGGTKVLISTDKGNTWVEPTQKNYINPAYRTENGSIVIPTINGWKSIDSVSAAQAMKMGVDVRTSENKHFTATGAHLQISTDGGKTWKRREIEIPSHALLMNYNGSSYLRTKKNVRLLAAYGKLKREDPDSVFFIRSVDDGITWQFSKMFREPPYKEGFNETALVETKEGYIVAIMRPDPDTIGYLYTSISKDSGVTWSMPQKTSIWGYPANAILLEDGRIFCSYGYRKSPMGIRGGILNADYSGLSGKEIIIRNDAKGSIANVGYPMAVEVGKSRVLVVYYITTADGITHVAKSYVSP